MPPISQQNVPDSRGHNAFRVDPAFRALLSVYLPKDLRPILDAQLDRMGALVGDRLEQLALTADKNPPTLSLRDRTGARRRADREASRL